MSETQKPLWRVRFNVLSSPGDHFILQIDNEIVLGRGRNSVYDVDLTPYDGESLGVSRRHVMLRPTVTKLYVMDLGSKHGTFTQRAVHRRKNFIPAEEWRYLNSGEASTSNYLWWGC